MGTEFAIIYDIISAALLIGMLFAGLRRGFASAIVSLAAVVLAFICAMTFSAPISDALYGSIVEQPLESAVSETIDEAAGNITLSSIADADYSAVRVNGISVEDITPEYSGTNKALFDLSNVDLSDTGITAQDLIGLGCPDDVDVSAVNGKMAEFTLADIERYGLGRMIVAQVIAVNIENASFFGTLSTYAQSVGEAIPVFFGDFAKKFVNGSDFELRSVILIMQSKSLSAKDAIVNGIVEPCVKILVQTVAFGIIFLVVVILLSLLSRLLKFVNKIPVIGGLNAMCGGIIGLIQGVFGIFVICLVVRLITILSGGNIMFFNSAAIESTFLFRVFYNFEFLNFIN